MTDGFLFTAGQSVNPGTTSKGLQMQTNHNSPVAFCTHGTNQIKSNQISFQVSTDKTRTRFPILAKIAQDVFSVCASSCPSETQFSKARKVANPWRSNLGHKSMQATLCLKSWYLMPELRGFEPVGQ